MTMSCLLYALVIASSMPSADALTVRLHTQEGMRAHMGMHARMGVKAQAKMGLHQDVNPIAKVLALLKKMLETNTEVDEEASRLCEKAICEWKRKLARQEEIVAHYRGNLPELEAEYIDLYSRVHMLKLDIRAAEQKIHEAEEELAAIKAQYDARIKKMIDDYKQNIAAVGRAIFALRKGLGATDKVANMTNMSMLQTEFRSGLGASLQKIITVANMTDNDRETLGAFLQAATGDHSEDSSGEDGPIWRDAPGTEEVIGILMQIKDTMEKELGELERRDFENDKEFEALVAAKQKQIDELKLYVSRARYHMADFLVRLTELHEQIVAILEGGYLREQKLLEEMLKEFEKIKKRCDDAKKERLEEKIALEEVIALLNTDESMELFKKTLPSMGGSSLLQLKVSEKLLKRRALSVLQGSGRKRDYRMQALCLAVTGKKVNMTKVVGMIDTLVDVLKQEAVADAQKKAYCTDSIGEALFKKKFLYHQIGPIKAAMAEVQAEIDEVKKEIDFVMQSLRDLDASVKEATEQRKKENELYLKQLALDNSAHDLLGVAKKRLTHFYGEMLQIGQGQGQAQEPVEEAGNATTFEAAEDIKVQHNGNVHKGQKVVMMVGALAHEIDMHIQENAHDEKMLQDAYDELLKEAQATKEEKLAYIRKLEDDKAQLDERYGKHYDEYREWEADDLAILRTIADLHKECDWLMENYAARIQAREDEIAALREAKTVLLGGDVGEIEGHEEGKEEQDPSQMGTCAVADMNEIVPLMPAECKNPENPQSIVSMLRAMTEMKDMDAGQQQAVTEQMKKVGVSDLCPCIEGLPEDVASQFKNCKAMPFSPGSMYQFWEACKSGNIPTEWGFLQAESFLQAMLGKAK